MSPSPFRPGGVRSAAVVNEQIRALVRRAQDGRWTQAERALYGLLVEEWTAAVRAEGDQVAGMRNLVKAA